MCAREAWGVRTPDGCPRSVAFLRIASRWLIELCANGCTLAPEPRTPSTIDEWLSESEMSSTPLPSPCGSTRTGMTNELVAKPMPMTIALGFSRKLATVSSSCACTGVEPASMRDEHDETPYVFSAEMTAGVQIGSTPPKPR